MKRSDIGLTDVQFRKWGVHRRKRQCEKRLSRRQQPSPSPYRHLLYHPSLMPVGAVVGVADSTEVDGTAAVGDGAQPQQALQLEPVSRWRPRLLITAAITATALTPMATATRPMPIRISVLTTVPIRTGAHTTAMGIHIDARIMHTRTGGMSCTGVTDTSLSAGLSDKNKAPDSPGL